MKNIDDRAFLDNLKNTNDLKKIKIKEKEKHLIHYATPFKKPISFGRFINAWKYSMGSYDELEFLLRTRHSPMGIHETELVYINDDSHYTGSVKMIDVYKTIAANPNHIELVHDPRKVKQNKISK